jgi:broad specificity phosphatase PhoE
MAEAALTLVRHGQTEWSQNGRHTSTTDLALLPEGRERAEGLQRVLDRSGFGRVISSPRARALQTARLAGFGEEVEIWDDLVEWDYGEYEGLTTPEIQVQAPGWNLWRDGCPGGESPAQVSARVDAVIARAVEGGGEVILFAHGHILRALSARWLGQDVGFGARMGLSPATISRLGHDHDERVLERWNALASTLQR